MDVHCLLLAQFIFAMSDLLFFKILSLSYYGTELGFRDDPRMKKLPLLVLNEWIDLSPWLKSDFLLPFEVIFLCLCGKLTVHGVTLLCDLYFRAL